MLTRESFLNNGVHFKRESVDVPELGGQVHVRQISALERDQFEKSIAGRGRGDVADNMRARLVILCAVDAAGTRLFRDEDADALGGLPVSVIEPIVEAAMRLNAMTPTAVEDARKNSNPTAPAGSPSG
jgi:hypothetical protein